ncbi:MAG: metallophosphatase [Coleofasciculus sp. S288]|nr:metallophosphatase [Coleofasciculus sp. S288]
MRNWAILSGIEGNIAAYEAVVADIKHQKKWVEDIYILGDFIGSRPESERVVQRIRSPKPNELSPQVCTGWWEEQCLILYGLGTTGEPTQLIEKYGAGAVKSLWDCVSRKTVEWIRSLDFGFFELDCLLIHGSSLSVDDELTPQTPPWQMCDRLMRMGANNLFCGRSGLAFEYELQGGSVFSTVTTLDGEHPVQTATASPRRVIGVGNVGREPGKATYTLYDPDTNRVEFRTIRYGIGQGFG